MNVICLAAALSIGSGGAELRIRRVRLVTVGLERGVVRSRASASGLTFFRTDES
jgi:hypothetical protein